MKGRPPTPTHLRAIDGNPSKRSLATQEPEPKLVTAHEAPAYFDARSRELWDRIIVDLQKYVGATILDLPKLELLCLSYGRYRQAYDAMFENKDGQATLVTTYTAHGRNGKQIKTRPEYHQMLEEARLMHSLMAEFGMSPAGRARLKGVGQGDLFDPLAELNRRYQSGGTAGSGN